MTGLSVESLAIRFIERYDRNRDGGINLTGKISSKSGRDRSEAAVHSLSVTDPVRGRTIARWNQGAPDVLSLAGARSVGLRDEYISAERLFRFADTDGNNTVTKAELGAAIRFFDTDKDGHLDTGETAKLDREFGETRGTVDYRFAPGSTTAASKGDADALGREILAQ
jgi:hypothetical protein